MPDRKRKKPLVPKLRFPEFQDAGEWTTKELGQLAKLISEKAGNKKVILMSVTAGIGLVSQIEKFGREIAGAQYKNYFVIEKNDFAYNKSATKDYPQGFIALYEGDEQAAVPNSIFTCFRVNEDEIVPRFLNYQFLNNLHGQWLQKFITIGARAHGSLNIDNKDLLALPVPLPSGKSSLKEQQKIAESLSPLDKLIELETQRCEALKAHKKGLMQQLFPLENETVPRLRFPEFKDTGEWEMKRLGKIFQERRERNGYGLELLSVTLSDGVVKSSQLDKKINTSADLSNYKKVYPNDIVYNSMRMWQGASGVSKWHGIVSPAYTVITPLAKQVSFFWEYYLKHPKNIDKFARFSQGVTSDTWNLKFPAFSRIRVSLPSPPEQQKIADCLSSLDKLIELQSRKVEALKQHKKGLMQQLFPQEVI